jgi:hypothetical protein
MTLESEAGGKGDGDDRLVEFGVLSFGDFFSRRLVPVLNG